MENKKERNVESRSIRQIRETFHLLNRHKGLVAAIFCTAITIGFLWAAYSTLIWRATGKIDVASGMNVPFSEVYKKTSQVEILQSDTLKKNIRQKMIEKGWGRSIPARNLEPKYDVQFVGNTTVVRINVDSPYPEYAVVYADALVNEYTIFAEAQKSESVGTASQELSQQIETLKKKLDAGQQQLINYKTSHDIILYDEAGNLPAKYAADLRLRLSDLATQRSILENQVEALKKTKDPYIIESTLASINNQTYTPSTLSTGTNGAPVSNTETSPNRTTVQRGLPPVYLLAESETRNYQQLMNQIEQQKVQIADDLKIYRDTHPKVVEEKNKLKDLESHLAAEVDNLSQRLNARYQTLKMEQSAVENALNSWESKATSMSVKGSQYEKLKDEFAENKRLYEYLSQKLNEFNVASNQRTHVQIVEKNHLMPKPVKPNKLHTILIAAILGLGLGLGTSFGIEYLDDTIRSADALQKYVGLPTLAVIPNFHLWENKPASERLIRIGEHHNPILEAFRTLRTSITFSAKEKNLKSIVITSSIPEEGKSLVSANLSASLAQAGQKTIAIDADLRKGSLHRFFGLQREKGLSDYLSGSIGRDEIIKLTNVENLSIITMGHHPDNPPELFSSPLFTELLAYLGEKYDRIIIDAPPAITVTEGAMLGSMADAVILVILGGEVPEALVNRTLEIVENSGGRVIGGVINKLAERDFDYYSYRYYHYYYGYHYQKPIPEKVES